MNTAPRLLTPLLALTAPLSALAGTACEIDGKITIGTMACNANKEMHGALDLLMNGALVFGVGLTLGGLWLLYQNKKDEGRTKASHGVVSLLVGAAMVFLPTVIEGTAATVFGDGSRGGKPPVAAMR